MIDMYVISGKIQDILDKSFLDTGKEKNFEDVVIELYERNDYITSKPILPEESFWSCLSDDEFLDLLNQIPVCINTILAL
jgi:hypothetical protein